MSDSTEVKRGLLDRIAHDGSIGIDDWMGACAAAYYAKGQAIGAHGDFITAPECTQMFGELLGLWAAVTWVGLGAPTSLALVELGPGRGTLMRDVLRAAESVPDFYRSIHVHLVETSPGLRKRQADALQDANVSVVWHDRLEDIAPQPMIVLANEFLDALPIRQYVRSGDTWRERRVTTVAQGLDFTLGPPLPDEPPHLQGAHRDAQEGETIEVCPLAHRIVAHLAGRLADAPGAALFIDYGPAHSRPGDSLQALRGHAYAPVLEAPGDSDLTAHVDFEALAGTARKSGAVAEPILPQGAFLVGLGLHERARTLLAGAQTEEQRLAISDALRRLCDPTQMGVLFKVMGIRSVNLPPLPGFQR